MTGNRLEQKIEEMKRILESGLALALALSLVGSALGPCCSASDAGCSQSADARNRQDAEQASMDRHCAPEIPVALTAPCCGPERGDPKAIGLNAPPPTLTAALSAASGAAVTGLATGSVSPARATAPAASPRSPILRL